MKLSVHTFALALCVSLLGGWQNAPVRDPIGCYLASPPFRTRAAIEPALDTARAIIAIDSGGVLRRPQLSREARVHGTWAARGDSLYARYSDGFSGWIYELGPTQSGWQGVAQYLTDEVNTGDNSGPVRRPATLTRIACPL
ncbi:MAG: hypothetical protein ABI852_01715 [Gemmatimonadaceae bacterium]